MSFSLCLVRIWQIYSLIFISEFNNYSVYNETIKGHSLHLHLIQSQFLIISLNMIIEVVNFIFSGKFQECGPRALRLLSPYDVF